MELQRKKLAVNMVLFSGIILASILMLYYIRVPIFSMIIGMALIDYLSISNMKMINNKKMNLLFLIILILKFLFLLYAMKVKDLTLGGVDWAYFNIWGRFVESNSKTIIDMLNSSFDLFTNITAIFYRIFETNPNQMFLYNFAMSLIAFKFIYKSTYLLTENHNKSMFASILFFVWPIEILYSVTFIREMTMQTLLIISVYNFIKFVKETKYVNIVASVISIMLACMMHSGVFGILLIYVLYLTFYKGDGVIKILSLKRIMAFILVMVIIFLTPLADKVLVTLNSINMRKRIITKIEMKIDDAVEAINEKIESLKKKEDENNNIQEGVQPNLEQQPVASEGNANNESGKQEIEKPIETKPEPVKPVEKPAIKDIEKNEIEVMTDNLMQKTKQDYYFLNEVEKGNTSYIKSNPTNMKETILQIPYRYINFVFAPFIWQVYDLPTFISFLFDGILQLFIWFTMIRWIFFDKDRSKKTMLIKITLLLMVLGTYFVFSWGTYTYGTAIRHRSKMLPIMICVIAISYDWEKLFRKIKLIK